jgi:hypothetical protein
MLPTDAGNEIRTRCVGRHTDHQKTLLEKLGWQFLTQIRATKM